MWLLKLHFAFSILCFITFVGFRRIYKQTLMDNGWKVKRRSIFELFAVFFVPILNVCIIAGLLTAISMKKSDYKEMMKKSDYKSDYKEMIKKIKEDE